MKGVPYVTGLRFPSPGAAMEAQPPAPQGNKGGLLYRSPPGGAAQRCRSAREEEGGGLCCTKPELRRS